MAENPASSHSKPSQQHFTNPTRRTHQQGTAAGSRHHILPPTHTSPQTPSKISSAARCRRLSSRRLTGPRSTTPTKPHPIPKPQHSPRCSNTLYPLHPLHRQTLRHFCHQSHPPHMPVHSSLTHTQLCQMAIPPHTTSGHTPHIPLQHLLPAQRSLCQVALQPTQLSPSIPPTRPHLHRLHQHWHCQARIQPPCQTQTTPEQPPHVSRTLTTILAFSTHASSL